MSELINHRTIKSITKPFCASLIFISLIGGTGLSTSLNQEVFAQFMIDEDGDSIVTVTKYS